MKRIIALSLVLVIALACIPFSASASGTQADVYAKMVAARNKLYSAKESFSAAESYDFWLFLDAQGNPDAYKDAYVKSVKDAVSDDSIGDAANCALAILCLQKLGFDPANFDLGETSVNLFDIMNGKSTDISSPYLYRYIFEAGASEEFADSCISAMNADYTKGTGYYYWGYSSDNNSAMGICYAASAKEPARVVDLALTLDSYKKDSGYMSNSDWGLDENVDSTGLALAFFSYTYNNNADETYDMLANYEVEGEDGAYFASYDPGNYNAYGTRDALIGLIEYYNLFIAPAHEHDYCVSIVTPATCTKQGTTSNYCTCCACITETTKALGHNYKAVVTAPKAYAIGYTQYKCSRCNAYKKDSAGKVVRTAFKAPTGKAKNVRCWTRTATAQTITWDGPFEITGYQVQAFNAKNKQVALKTVKAGAWDCTFTKLAPGTLYRFRVRFYIKGSDGKNYFSAWTSLLNSSTLPTGTSLVKVTPAKKALTAKWKANKTVSGYQVNYLYHDRASGAPNCKTVTIKGNAKTSYTVKKLLGGTKYEVKVRTYKTVGGKNYFSNWSAAKTVITKK